MPKPTLRHTLAPLALLGALWISCSDAPDSQPLPDIAPQDTGGDLAPLDLGDIESDPVPDVQDVLPDPEPDAEPDVVDAQPEPDLEPDLPVEDATDATADGIDETVAIPACTAPLAWAEGATSGTRSWVTGLAPGFDESVAAAGSFSGSVALSGAAEGSGEHTAAGELDVLVALYDSLGALRWSVRLGGSEDDLALSVGRAPDGDVLVAGSFTGNATFGTATLSADSATDVDGFALRLAAVDGAVLWLRQLSGEDFGEVAAIAPASEDGAWIAATFEGTAVLDGGASSETLTATATDVFVARYDADGDLDLALHGAGGGLARIDTLLPIDGGASVLVAGPFEGTLSFDSSDGDHPLTALTDSRSSFLVEIDSDGDITRSSVPLSGPSHVIGGLAAADDGTVYVAGAFEGELRVGAPGEAFETFASEGGSDAFVAALDPSLDLVDWELQFGGTGDDFGRGLVLDDQDVLWLSGALTDEAVIEGLALQSLGGRDAFLMALTDTGAATCANALGGSAADESLALVFSDNAALYLAGGFAGTATFEAGHARGVLTTTADSGVFVAKFYPRANGAPVAVDDPVSTAEDAPVTIDVLANDTDPDEDALTLLDLSLPASGTLEIEEDQQVTFTPEADFSGVVSFGYLIGDGNGGTDAAVVTVTVTAENDQPGAVGDEATTAEDTPVNIDVVDNDSDPDGDLLSVASVGNPANGAAEIDDDGTVLYTPDPDFNGSDSFTYTVEDPGGAQDTATVDVTVTPVNDDPIANPDLANTDNLTAVAIDVLDNDTDVDDDVLEVSATTDPPNGAVVVNLDETVTYTPDGDFVGEDVFTYTVSDGAGGSDTATVTVTIVDEEPPAVEITAPAAGAAVTDEAVTIVGTAQDNIAVTALSYTIDGGAPVDITGELAGTAFDFDLELPPGATTIRVIAADASGNAGFDEVRVVICPTPVPFHKVWVGGAVAGAQNWSLAANWFPTGVPTASQDVFVCVVPDLPQLTANVSARDLFVPQGAEVDTTGFTLTASGDVVANGPVMGTGVLRMNGANTTIEGTVGNLRIESVVTAAAATTATGNVALTVAGTLDPGGFLVTVGGDLTVDAAGLLRMQAAADTVDVAGSASFGGAATNGQMTAGELRVGGNFSQVGCCVGNWFSPSGTFRVVFDGAAEQSVSFGNPGFSSQSSFFEDVDVADGAVVQLSSDIVIRGATRMFGDGTLDQDALRSLALTTELPQTTAGYLVDDTRVVVSMDAVRDAELPNGGNLRVNSGVDFDVNGFTIEVSGNLDVSGTLTMQDALDVLDVRGDVTFQGGATNGLLTNGDLRIGGDFTQVGCCVGSVFGATSSHETVFDGGGTQNVTFGDAGPDAATDSHFRHLRIAEGTTVNFTNSAFATGNVVVESGEAEGPGPVAIGGNLEDSVGDRWQVEATTFTGSPALPAALITNATFTGLATIQNSFTLTGNLAVAVTGRIDVGAHTITATGSFTSSSSGVLRMQNDAGVLDLGGNATFGGASTSGQLTAGRIELEGNFVQTGCCVGNWYSPSGTHRMVFDGGGASTATFGDAGFGSQDSLFNSIEVENGTALTFDSTVFVRDELILRDTATLEQSTGSTGFVTELPQTTDGYEISDSRVVASFDMIRDATIPNGGNLRTESGVDLDLDGHELTVSGNLTVFGTVTMQDAADILTVLGDVTFQGGATNGLLTNGELRVGGDFTQVGCCVGSVFGPSTNHVTVFNGGDEQSVSFGDAGPDATTDSRFRHVRIENDSTVDFLVAAAATGNVVIDSGLAEGPGPVTIGGNLTDTVGDRWTVNATVFSGSPSLPATFITNATFTGLATLQNSFDLTGNLAVAVSGRIDVGAHTVTVSGSFTSTASGVLRMQNDAGLLDVAGDATFGGGATNGQLTAGRLEVGGSFTQTGCCVGNWYTPSGTHRMVFDGGGNRTATFADPGFGTQDSLFNAIDIENGTALTFDSIVLVRDELVLLDTATLDQSTGHTGYVTELPQTTSGYEVSDSRVVASFDMIRDEDIPNGGLLRIESGVDLDLDGHTLTLTGNLNVFGTVTMQDAADLLDVTGDVTFQGGSTNGLLTAGALHLEGDFSQVGCCVGSWYAPSSAHMTVFDGSDQTVTFGDPGADAATDSHFQHVRIDQGTTVNFSGGAFANGSLSIVDGIAEGPGPVTIAGNLGDAEGDRWQVEATTFSGDPDLPASFITDATFTGAATLSAGFALDGSLTVSAGVLTLGAHTVSVTENFATIGSGALQMTNSAGRLAVAGNASFGGGSTSGRLTAGTLLLEGNFSQVGCCVGSWFTPSGDFLVEMTGVNLPAGTSRTVSFADPGTSSTDSSFQNVIFRDGIEVSFTSNVFVEGALEVMDTATLSQDGLLSTAYTSQLPVTTDGYDIADSRVIGLIQLTEPATLPGADNLLRITTGGSIDVEGQSLAIEGELAVESNGTLVMTNANDSVVVGGDATFGGGAETGLLTNGLLEVGGSFTQSGCCVGSWFLASGSHRTRLTGSGTVAFGDPGSDNASSSFRRLELADTASYEFTSDTFVTDDLDLAGDLQLGTGIDVSVSVDLFLRLNALLENDGTLTYCGQLFDDGAVITGNAPIDECP